MENSAPLITLAIAIVGLLGSLSLFQKRRKMASTLQRAILRAPPDKDSIRDYRNDRANQERLDAFYDAYKTFKFMQYWVFGLGFFILLLLAMFYIELNKSDIRIAMQQVAANTDSSSILTFKSAAGRQTSVSLPHRKIAFVQIDDDGSIYLIPIRDNEKNYLIVSASGRISQANIPELVLGVLVFVFIISIVVCMFFMGRMDDFIDNFEELTTFSKDA